MQHPASQSSGDVQNDVACHTFREAAEAGMLLLSNT
jgi:hypothetical protein